MHILTYHASLQMLFLCLILKIAIPSMTAGHRLRQRHFPGRLAQEASAHHEPGLGLHGLDLRHPRNRPGFLVVIGH